MSEVSTNIQQSEFKPKTLEREEMVQIYEIVSQQKRAVERKLHHRWYIKEKSLQKSVESV